MQKSRMHSWNQISYRKELKRWILKYFCSFLSSWLHWPHRSLIRNQSQGEEDAQDHHVCRDQRCVQFVRFVQANKLDATNSSNKTASKTKCRMKGPEVKIIKCKKKYWSHQKFCVFLFSIYLFIIFRWENIFFHSLILSHIVCVTEQVKGCTSTWFLYHIIAIEWIP